MRKKRKEEEEEEEEEKEKRKKSQGRERGGTGGREEEKEVKKRRKRGGRREAIIRTGRSTRSHNVDHFNETQTSSIRRKKGKIKSRVSKTKKNVGKREEVKDLRFSQRCCQRLGFPECDAVSVDNSRRFGEMQCLLFREKCSFFLRLLHS